MKYILEKASLEQDSYVLTDLENLVVIKFKDGDYKNTYKITFLGDVLEGEEKQKILDEAYKFLTLHRGLECQSEKCGLSFSDEFDFSDPESEKNQFIFFCREPLKIKVTVNAADFSREKIIESLKNIIDFINKNE